MPDREKVMRAMMYCVGDIKEVDENDECRGDICPYKVYADVDGYSYCQDHMIRDALALLKEQDEGVAPIESTTEQKKFADRIGFAVSEFWCGECHFNLVGHPKFCPNCGKRVKWDD